MQSWHANPQNIKRNLWYNLMLLILFSWLQHVFSWTLTLQHPWWNDNFFLTWHFWFSDWTFRKKGLAFCRGCDCANSAEPLAMSSLQAITHSTNGNKITGFDITLRNKWSHISSVYSYILHNGHSWQFEQIRSAFHPTVWHENMARCQVTFQEIPSWGFPEIWLPWSSSHFHGIFHL